MKLTVLLVVAAALVGISCEKHEFEGPNGTKRLHEKHGHSDHHDSEHGEDKGHAESH